MPNRPLRPLRTRDVVVTALALLIMAPAAAFFDGNKSIRVDDGQQSGGQSTVNGSITIGRDATIDGTVETVNGTIRVGENSRIERAETVNGSVRLADGVTATGIESVNGSIGLGGNVVVEGEVAVVNGKIEIGRGSRVAEDVSNVNGEIEVSGAEIGGDLTTVNGDVYLKDETVIVGDLVIEEPDNLFGDTFRRKPKVVIGPGVAVQGDVRLEREVELYISDSASVGGVEGVMSMADAIRFSGARP